MMAAERRVLDVVDSAYAGASADTLPPMTAKRKIHSDNDPLPAPTNPPKRAKKTVRQLIQEPMSVYLICEL